MLRFSLPLALCLFAAPLSASNLTDDTSGPSLAVPAPQIAALDDLIPQQTPTLTATIGGSAMLPGLGLLTLDGAQDLQAITQPATAVQLLK
ncbi:hypothetical protein AB3Y40_04660 [Yoonia sp. R2331]|uniref:hypothetical protein n=1 Tax=Yoonia sp. R2331 TaxID=3237238 RepID=UPI0034E3A0C9